jgi:glycosyltransferase involved in cell wall biosynthesis
MQHVLFIASKPFFPWRSPCIRAGHDLLALSELGYAVDFLTVPIGAHPAMPGVRIRRVPNLLLLRDLPDGASLRKMFCDLLLLAYGIALALRHRYTVVHGMDDAGVLAWIIGRIGRSAVVFEKHTDTSHAAGGAWRRFLFGCYRRAERFVLRRVDTAIGSGPELVPAMQTMGCGSRACRIHDIPSSLDTPPEAHVTACRARLTPHMDVHLVTYVGSFTHLRGVRLFFEAIPQVCAVNNRVHFVVVGGTPEEAARQRHRLARENLAGAVTFLHQVEPTELAAILAASDILAAPRVEGFLAPRKLLDYLCAGNAIVATDVPANRDLLSRDLAEFTEPTAEAFAQGILKLCRNPMRRHELGRRGRERILSTHRFDQFRDQLRRCYQYATATRAPEAPDAATTA